MALIPQFFTDSVVAIGFETADKKIFWSASGFFYFHTIDGSTGRVYLVTNKHVFLNKKNIYIRLNPKALKTPKDYVLNLENPITEETLWKGHYSHKVDVAVIPVNFNLLQNDDMQVGYFHDGKNTLDTLNMKTKGFSEGDNVFALGFPVSLVGDKSNSVLVRGGTVARVRDTLKNPLEPYLIDTTVFPGNSGGPVVNKPEFISIEGTKSISTAYLIGIIASYVPYRDYAVSKQTGNLRVVFEENSGLSNVFSVDCINTTIRSFEKGLKKLPQLANPEVSDKASEETKL